MRTLLDIIFMASAAICFFGGLGLLGAWGLESIFGDNPVAPETAAIYLRVVISSLCASTGLFCMLAYSCHKEKRIQERRCYYS